MSSKELLIRYLHQALFSPSKLTLIKAINNNQFASWSGLTAAAVNKYLPDSIPATDKGHMKRQKKGIRLTTDKMTIEMGESKTQQCINPPIVKEQTNQLFGFHAMLDKKDGHIYVDYTGTFLIRSIDGMTTIFILYNWTTSAILATPVKDVKVGPQLRHSKATLSI